MGALQNMAEMFLGNREKRAAVPDKAGLMKKYELAQKNGEYMLLSFSRADSITGDLSLVDGDITVLMPSDQINGKPYDLRYRAQKLGDVYCVKIMSIDALHKHVYVSHQAARMEKRPEIERELQKGLEVKEGTPVIARGKVLRIQSRIIDGEAVDTGVWMDLCGVGIPAFIYIGNWQKTYTETLRGKAAYGDILDVVVLERVARKNGMYYYSCSRKELVDDPWEDKTLGEKYHKGDIVKIRCLSKKENHWFGEINGLADIQVFVEYPSPLRGFAIVPGMEYMGTIYHISPQERSLKARVFQALSLERLEEEDRGQDAAAPEEGEIGEEADV